MSNLINLRERTEEEQRQIARQGGIASGAARREKRLLRDTLLDLLSRPVPDEVCELTGCAGGDFSEAVCAALVRSALSGNPRAFEVLRDSVGERPSLAVEQAEPQQLVFTLRAEDGNGNLSGEDLLDELGG